MILDCIEKVQPADQLVAPALPAWSKNRPLPWADAPHVDGLFLGASQLASCAAAIGYRLTGVPKSNPMGEAGFHSVGLGSLVHGAIQTEITERPPGDVFVGVEVPWQLEASPLMVVRSFADLAFGPGPDDIDEVSDIKTSAPFGFKLKSTREGPDRRDILQTAAGARALGAERCRIVYIATAELKGRDRIETDGYLDFRENRYTEYVFPTDAPEITEMLDAELERLARIAEYVNDGKADQIPRAIPGVTPKGARIVDPVEGAWQLWVRPSEDEDPKLFDTGTVWQCRYCDWQDHCAEQIKGGEADVD